jgi:hypothetical protein
MCRSESYGDCALLMVYSVVLWSVKDVGLYARFWSRAEVWGIVGHVETHEHLLNKEGVGWTKEHSCANCQGYPFEGRTALQQNVALDTAMAGRRSMGGI